MKKTKMTATMVLALCLLVCVVPQVEAEPMGTAITYQGRLIDKNKPADGLYDFQFRLYDSNDPCTGTQLASPIDINNLDVIDGHFVVELDFGNGIFDGNAVWLETRVVRSPMGSDPAALSPLLELTPAPYSLYAKTAETAGGDGDWKVSEEDMYSIPTGTVKLQRSRGASGPVLEVSRGFTTPTIGRTWMEIDDTLIDTYSWIFGGQTVGTSLGLNSNSSGNVILAGGGGSVGIGTTNPLSKLSVGGDGITDVGVFGQGSTSGVSGSDSDTGSYGRLGYDNYGVYGSGQIGVNGEGTWGVLGLGSAGGVAGTDRDTGRYGRLGYDDWGGYFYGKGFFSDNVGIGTTNPLSKLSVGGDGFVNTGVYGGGHTYGVYGNGTASGVYGISDSVGVKGVGSTVGVMGEDIDSGSYGRLGDNDKGVYGNGTYGGYFVGKGYFGGDVGIGTTSPTEKVEVAGNVKLSGTGNGIVFPDGTKQTTAVAFPRPAYDSGWCSVPAEWFIIGWHYIGGDPNNYVVDMQQKGASGPSNYGLGGFYMGVDRVGFDYGSLTDTNIKIYNYWESEATLRVRIWVYN